MTELLSAVQSEQRRQSEEMAAMRSMHMDLIKGMSELVTRLGIFEVQHREAMSRDTEVRGILREHTEKIEGLRISQASNEYVISLVKAANRNIFLAMIGAMGSAGAAAFTIFKG